MSSLGPVCEGRCAVADSMTADNHAWRTFDEWWYGSEEAVMGDRRQLAEAAWKAGHASHWMEVKGKEWDGPSLDRKSVV